MVILQTQYKWDPILRPNLTLSLRVNCDDVVNPVVAFSIPSTLYRRWLCTKIKLVVAVVMMQGAPTTIIPAENTHPKYMSNAVCQSVRSTYQIKFLISLFIS